MNKKTKEYCFIFIRYFLLILAPLGNLAFFYVIFTPLTLYLSYFLINIFFDATISGNYIFFGNNVISMIPACVAGSAYYLLLILNLSTRGILIKKRIALLISSFVSFLILNSIRILLLAVILNYSQTYFNSVHLLFWYLLSTIFVVLIWFVHVKIFNIKEIPVYSDLIELKKLFYKK